MERVENPRLLTYWNCPAEALFEKTRYPWEVLPHIRDFILKLGPTLPAGEYELVGENLWVHKNVQIASSALVEGPAIICDGASLRHCAYVRGDAIICSGCVVGNSTEVKNSVMLPGSKAPHFNYVGDSVLGVLAHLGAGVILSNLRLDGKNIVLHFEGERHETMLRKFGAIIGDSTEIGCNSVLNPGTIIAKKTHVPPLSNLRGCCGF